MKALSVVIALFLFIGFTPPFANAEGLEAATASVDITPPIGVPLGGFGGNDRRLKFPFDLFNQYKWATVFKPSEGVRDPIRAKVMLLKNAEKKLVFISLDTVGVTEEVYKDILVRLSALGYRPDDVFISATHTHSGPGTLSDNLIWEIIAMDFFQRDIFEMVMNGILSGVLQAESRLEPADLLSYSFTADGLQSNRRKKEGHFDPQANVMVLRSSSGAWLGGMTNLAVHGTGFSGKNLLFSADVPGSIERQMESRFSELNQSIGISKPVTFLFVNGAEGDVGPKYGQSDGVDLMGVEFATQAMKAFSDARIVSPTWSVHSVRLDLGMPGLSLSACGTKIPLVKALKIGVGAGILGAGIPRAPRLSVLRLGDMALLTWPGEPTTSLGLAVKSAYYADPNTKQVWVMGLTNGYVAYFTTTEEFFEGSYESCSSLYGPSGGERIVDEYRALSNMSLGR